MNRTIWLLSIAAFLAAAMTRMTDALLPEIAREFAVGIEDAAFAITAFTFAYGSFQLAYGWIGSKIGPYRTVAIATGLAATGAIVSALASDLTWLAIGRFWSGMTVAAVIPMSMAYIGETIPYDKRQPVIARFLMGQVIGVIAGVAFAGFFAQVFNWRDLFWALALGLFLIAIALWRELASGRVAAFKTIDGSNNPIRAYINVLRVPWARIILMIVFVEGLIFGTYPYLAPHLAENFAVEPLFIGLTMACFGVGGLIYISLVGRLHGRFGETGLAIGGGTSFAIGFFLLAILPSGIPITIGVIIAGFGYIMLHNTLQTNATQMAPFDRSSAISLFACCLFVSQSIGVALTGQIALFVSYPTIFIASGILFFALALVFYKTLKHKH